MFLLLVPFVPYWLRHVLSPNIFGLLIPGHMFSDGLGSYYTWATAITRVLHDICTITDIHVYMVRKMFYGRLEAVMTILSASSLPAWSGITLGASDNRSIRNFEIAQFCCLSRILGCMCYCLFSFKCVPVPITPCLGANPATT
jgi:hypothetical protein